MLVQEIIGYRKRTGIVHLSRWRREQSRSAVHKLCICRQGQKGQNQYEGYAFDDAKLVIIFRTTPDASVQVISDFTFLKIAYNALCHALQDTLT